MVRGRIVTALDVALTATCILAVATFAAWVAEQFEVTRRRATDVPAILAGGAGVTALLLAVVGERTTVNWWAVLFYGACVAVALFLAFAALLVIVRDAPEADACRRMVEKGDRLP